MNKRTGFFNSPLFFFEETESTIIESKKFLESQQYNFVQGSTFMAAYQTKGKGQQGRSWYATPNSCVMYTSIFDVRKFSLYNIHINQASQLSMVCANALVKTIYAITGKQQQRIEVFIKWPNDVLIDEKKISGILTEQKGNIILLSNGVNIKKQYIQEKIIKDNNQFNFTPISLEELNIKIDILEFFEVYKISFESEIQKEPQEIFAFSNDILWRKNKKVRFMSSVLEDVFIHEIGQDGSLVVEGKDGGIEYKYSGSIINECWMPF